MSADLVVGIGSDNSELNRGLSDAQTRINNFSSSVSQMGTKLAGIGAGLTASITLPIIALGTASVKAYGDIQSLQKGLEAVMGSAKLAEGEFTKLIEVAKLPGLGLKEATRGSVTLQAAGFSADQARRSLLSFGNALATVGKGGAELGLVNLALSQLQNKSGGFGQDLRQLTEQLPQLRAALQSAFGTIDTDSISRSGVTGRQVVEALIIEFEKLPKVSGGINNAFENLKDTMFINLQKIGKIIDKTFDISATVDKIGSFVDSIVSGFESLSPPIQKAIVIFGAVASAIGPILVVVGGFLAVLPSMISGVGALSGVFAALTGPVGLVIIALIAVVTAVTANWDKIKPYIINTINYFIDLYNESLIVRIAVQALVTSFKNSFTGISAILSTAWEVFKTFAKGVADLFGGVGSIIKGALTLNPTEFLKGIGQIGTAYAVGFQNLKKDLTKGVKDLSSGLGKNIDEGLNNVLKREKVAKVTDIKIFDKEKVAEKTKSDLVAGITEGVKSANKEINQIVSENLGGGSNVNIEPVIIKVAGVKLEKDIEFDFLGEEAEMARRNSEIINNSVASIPISMSESSLSIRENLLNIRDSFSQMSDFGNFLGETISASFNFVVDTIADSFSSIGEAMATGGNIFSAFGSTLLSSIGAFLGDLGKQMIQYGVAALAMATLTKMLQSNPITAAPAAIGMIAAGAALSLISGAIKGTLSRGSGGGGSVPTSGGASSGAQYQTSFSNGGSSSVSNDVTFRISGNDLIGVLARQQDRNNRLNGGN